MKNLNLVLHCGGTSATREQVAKIKTPSPRGRWYPIGHEELINQVEGELNKLNMRIVTEALALSQEGQRMFGLLQIGNCKENKDYSWVAGIRNSHDKSFPAGLAVGSACFCCDNLAFSSEIVFGRRHTLNIVRDLPLLVAKATGELAAKWDSQGKRIDMSKETGLSRSQAADLLITAMEEKIFPKTRIDDIWNEWKTPRHPEFQDRNVWSFFNSVTEHLKVKPDSKATSLWDLPARTNRLHAICDSTCGVDLSSLKDVEVELVSTGEAVVNN